MNKEIETCVGNNIREIREKENSLYRKGRGS